jgi:hypothetical protein
VVDADWPRFPTIPLGHIVGAMRADEAVAFAALALALHEGRATSTVLDDVGACVYAVA